MISPKAVDFIIKHFDAIDKVVSKRLNRKRPWSEPSLTSLLCDLMDHDTQDEEKIEYSIDTLNKDLEEFDGLLDVSFIIETHEYSPKVERWITQSDLGLIINFEDHLLPKDSWSISWLLQAKKVFPDKKNPVEYSESSKFQSYNPKQSDRIKKLIEGVGIDFVKYLLFCPRPSDLKDDLRKKLTHLRNKQLSNHIFDYTLGLELKDELSKFDSSLAAGLFISPTDDCPRNLGSVHKEIFNLSIPFSWFMASHFAGRSFESHDRFSPVYRRKPLKRSKSKSSDSGHGNEEIADAIVRGDESAIRHINEILGQNIDIAFPILPPHTMTINVSVGSKMNSNTRQIWME